MFFEITSLFGESPARYVDEDVFSHHLYNVEHYKKLKQKLEEKHNLGLVNSCEEVHFLVEQKSRCEPR